MAPRTGGRRRWRQCRASSARVGHRRRRGEAAEGVLLVGLRDLVRHLPISPPVSGAPSRRRRLQLGSHALLLVCWFGSDGILKSGSSGFTRTRTRIFGYPKCRVFIISDKFRVTVFKTRNFKNPKNPTRNFRVTRMPTHRRVL